MAKSVSNAQSDSVKEVWLPIVGWEGMYEVSDLGRVRSLSRIIKVRCGCGHGFIERDFRGRVLKPRLHLGYPMVQLARDGMTKPTFVHRMVCEAFHGPCPPDKQVVAHNDGDRTNATPANLRWATVKENAHDTFLHGRLKRGIDAFGAKLTDEQVQDIRRNANADPYHLAERHGVQVGHILRVIRGDNRSLPTDEHWSGEWLAKGDRLPRWGLTKKDKDYILRNPENKRVAELAEMFGITDKRIYQLRSDNKEKKRPRSEYPRKMKEYIAANPDGLSSRELADRFAINHRQVISIRHWMKQTA